MKMGLYIIYDRVKEESHEIKEFKNDATARRWYTVMIAKGIEPGYEDDYMLLRLGEIDHETNLIFLEETPQEIIAKLSEEAEIHG